MGWVGLGLQREYAKMSRQQVQGRCLCRAVIFEYDGEPNWTLHCHCESCRRATSSPMTTWISVPRSAFRFKQGTPRHFNSSPGVARGFCGTCGSPLTYESERIPDEVHLYAASLVNPLDVKPMRHVFVEEQLPWLEIADRLPRFAKTSRGGAQPTRYGPIE
jgi:hypothetical protein